MNVVKSAHHLGTMKFKQQTGCAIVRNFDNIFGRNTIKDNRRHNKYLPNNIRCLVVGPSNSGKTNAVFNLLIDPCGLRFKNVYVFSKSLYQEKYEGLKDLLDNIEGISYYPYGDNSEVIPPEETAPDSIMIFDDVACEKQNNIVKYFTMGRHNNIDVFYLCQTYSKIPKQLVRDNANFLLIFRMDDRNLRHIFHDHITPDMMYEEFKQMCNEAWSQDSHAFLAIDKERGANKGRYRIKFDTFITNFNKSQESGAQASV